MFSEIGWGRDLRPKCYRALSNKQLLLTPKK
jgi:hypothetical protein